MALNLVVPDFGDLTDPETIQQIFDDLTLLRSDVDKLLSRRIATTTRTSSTSTFTAETVLDSVTGTLVSGRIYRVVYRSDIQSSVGDGYTRNRLREDNISGTQVQLKQVSTAAITAAQGQGLDMEYLYTAVSSGSKTFVATGSRQAGTGNIQSNASATAPVYLYIEYVSG